MRSGVALGLLRDRLRGAGGGVTEDVFDPVLFSRLDRMRLRVDGVYGRRGGESPVRGLSQATGIEVESHQPYTPGDDVRYLDWSALGRLDQLVTRRFVAERELPVHVLLDTSASMGTPAEDRKLSFAVRLAAALAYIALNDNEPVRVAAFRQRGAELEYLESPLFRHRGRYPRLRPFLEGLSPSGGTALVEGASRYAERHRERGIAFVLSDFLVEPAAVEATIARLEAAKLRGHAVVVTGRGERELPGLHGRFRIRDAETGATREVRVTEADRRRYRESFAARVSALRELCHRHRVGLDVAFAEEGVERYLTRSLSGRGILRLR